MVPAEVEAVFRADSGRASEVMPLSELLYLTLISWCVANQIVFPVLPVVVVMDDLAWAINRIVEN